ncbi:DNA ligase (ATP) DNL4 [Sugiyamaella lignohabitans]|uniref:DNA ligase (ATP) DNL4 n=1 Tax=Sugiyamaella lignohabitans TaxID=796027 RepID=A0A167CYF3_9ASCO|nr:DNA ligase (ATP) DNL4 [Sugiyamaella lignohabitans]ANB12256.1 DNA ligase (ATP) DNL4 [Sugiyamaella lignohabitans]
MSDATASVDTSAMEEELVQPKNFGKSPPFNKIVTGVFLPLQRHQLEKAVLAKRKTITAIRHEIIANFIANWKRNVGDDIYPAFRLILPEIDRERQMYHLKENTLGRLLVKVLHLDKKSPDAIALREWKRGPSSTAGNFSERVYDILAKRDTHSTYGDMTVDEVNSLLDTLSTSKSAEQQGVLRKFLTGMNAEELRWLTRIILRFSRIGVTETTIFQIYHPDAVALYNITSDMKRVCWQLWDTNYRIPNEESQIRLMSCFRPQLAAFTKHSNKKIVDVMPDSGFYMEEKIDGERMQVHFTRKQCEEDGQTVEKVQLKFFSRKGKDYTYLYGSNFDDPSGSLAPKLRTVIDKRVRNCIFDGEMVGWDSEEDMIELFGSLKTAAKAGTASKSNPLYIAYDLVHLNGRSLVNVPLSQRKKMLDGIVTPVKGYFMVLPYPIGKTEKDIETRFLKIIEEA